MYYNIGFFDLLSSTVSNFLTIYEIICPFLFLPGSIWLFGALRADSCEIRRPRKKSPKNLVKLFFRFWQFF